MGKGDTFFITWLQLLIQGFSFCPNIGIPVVKFTRSQWLSQQSIRACRMHSLSALTLSAIREQRAGKVPFSLPEDMLCSWNNSCCSLKWKQLLLTQFQQEKKGQKRVATYMLQAIKKQLLEIKFEKYSYFFCMVKKRSILDKLLYHLSLQIEYIDTY